MSDLRFSFHQNPCDHMASYGSSSNQKLTPRQFVCALQLSVISFMLFLPCSEWPTDSCCALLTLMEEVPEDFQELKNLALGIFLVAKHAPEQSKKHLSKISEKSEFYGFAQEIIQK